LDFGSLLGELVKIIGGAGAGAGAMRWLFRVDKDLEICKTRFKQKTPGWPWNGEIGIHRMKDGWEILLIEPGGNVTQGPKTKKK